MSVYYEDDMVQLRLGDSLAEAREIESGAVQTIVTSPPYYGLRDYGEDGQYGGEGSVSEYVGTMRALFHELRRVLADDGTLWLNLGDSYTGSWGAQGHTGQMDDRRITKIRDGHVYQNPGAKTGARRPGEPAAKNLLGVPWRVAFALQEDGWYLRSEIIWSKPNPMPESITDRPSKAHETIFLFAKSPRYFYDAAAIAEPAIEAGRFVKPYASDAKNMSADPVKERTKAKGNILVGDTRNKRTVWTVPTVPFTEAHFAVYPPELIRPCILAGSRAGDIVLDPFSGSGTTGMVAQQEGRRYLGIDLNSEYLDLSLRTRFLQPTLGVEVAV